MSFIDQLHIRVPKLVRLIGMASAFVHKASDAIATRLHVQRMHYCMLEHVVM